jgi:hypothetical protein
MHVFMSLRIYKCMHMSLNIYTHIHMSLRIFKCMHMTLNIYEHIDMSLSMHKHIDMSLNNICMCLYMYNDISDLPTPSC